MLFALGISILLGGAAPLRPVPDYMVRLDRCASADAPVAAPCILPIPISPSRAATLLGERDRFWWIAGDRLSLIARPTDEDGWAMLCCAIQTPLEPIGDTGIVGITVRVPRMAEAILDIAYYPERRPIPPDIVRGVAAPQPPRAVSPLRGRITVIQFESHALGEKRRIDIYVPPVASRAGKFPVLYLADGDVAGFAPIAEALTADGRAAPFIIVGIHPGTGRASGCAAEPCDQRRLDYKIDDSPGPRLADTPFGRHLRFVADELIPFVEREYPASPRREDRVTMGYSNGASWAFAAAEQRPDLFGNVLAMSSSSKMAAAQGARLAGTRVYAGAGLFEQDFHDITLNTVDAARAAGARTRWRPIVSGHSRPMWDILFADGIAWLLPAHR
jgi:enterochelin esterase-like enzyme